MPIPFTCPHCGAATLVADRFAGQRGPCASCGQTIVIPATGGAETRGAPPAARAGSRWVLFAVLAAVVALPLLFFGAILAGLLLPAVQSARAAARDAACRHNMRQIAVAIEDYRTVHGHYPPSYVADQNGRPLHSWRVLILPYLERQDLYDQYDFDEPWDGPNNRRLHDRMPDIFACPEVVETGGRTTTNYVVVSGPGAIFDGPRTTSRQEITDDPAQTILLVEMEGANIHWLEPRDLDKQTMTFEVNAANDGHGIFSFHPRGANVVFADLHVGTLEGWISPEEVEMMVTRSGGEKLGFTP